MAALFKGEAVGKGVAAPAVMAIVQSQLSAEFSFIYLPYLGTTGVSLATLAPPLVLPRNALVQRFDIVVGATRATRTPAQAAGQVRAYDNAGVHTVIIDFGVPRTVSSVSVGGASTLKILEVAAWIGAKFDNPFFGPVVGPSLPVDAARFSSEVRTERLLVTVSAAANAATIGADLELELPELPSDLVLRINDGAPVWAHNGPAQADTSDTLSADRFNKQGKRLVPLADALNALLADPLASDQLTLAISLSVKVPGVLSLALADTEVWRINRQQFAGDSSTTLAFAAEGRQALPLTLPAPAAGQQQVIKRVQFTALATPGPDRVLPPEGPAPALSSVDGALLADLVLDADRAAAVRLPASPVLAELTGLRLPLAAGGDGAELRVVLWGHGADGPAQPLPGGASEPLTLAASSPAGSEAWVSVSFAKPVPLDPLNPPWAALLVSRGTLTWALARRTDAPGCDLRRGAPNGPWRPLPPAFTSPAGVLDACGRLRRVGRAPKDQPLAPWWVSLDGDAQRAPVPATAKGASVLLAPALGSSALLQVLAHGPGNLGLRDIDVVWAEMPGPAN